MTFKSRPVEQLCWGLVPMHYDQWGIDSGKLLDRATSVRPVWFMPWDSHVVSEGMVDSNEVEERLR